MGKVDFYEQAAKVEMERLNEILEKLGITPNPEFSEAWETFLVKDKRRTANRRRKRANKVNERDDERSLLNK